MSQIYYNVLQVLKAQILFSVKVLSIPAAIQIPNANRFYF